MTKNTTNLLGILITIIAGTYFFMTYCSACGADRELVKANQEEAPVSVAEATSNPFAFRDEGFEFSAEENFNFELSSATIKRPVSDNVHAGINSLNEHLNAHLDKVLNITGYYTGNETNHTAFPNLGLARANAAKNYLASLGISPSRMNSKGQLKDDMVSNNSMLNGPITYGIEIESEADKAEVHALFDKISSDPLILYFNTAEAEINLNPEQRQKIAEISRYIDKVEEAKCKIVGHTDNSGQRETNIVLGQERADFAKSYLIANGIQDLKIIATSAGPDAPIASNDTEEGMALNRRTVITLN
jgi:outer membrane protein OmpA-like peptidoglycan-associated protein